VAQPLCEEGSEKVEKREAVKHVYLCRPSGLVWIWDVRCGGIPKCEMAGKWFYTPSLRCTKRPDLVGWGEWGGLYGTVHDRRSRCRGHMLCHMHTKVAVPWPLDSSALPC
jgi:hypothetical protein